MKATRQVLELRPNESFHSYRYAEADFYAPYHFHPELEIVMIEAGRGLRVVGDHTGSFAPADLCMFGSDLPHIFRADDTTHGAVSLVVQFRLDVIEPLLGFPEMKKVKQLIELCSHGIHFSKAMSTAARAQIQQLSSHDRKTNKLILLVQLLETLAQEASFETLVSPGYVHQASDLGNSRIAKVWELILEREGVEPTQAQVADELGMSVSSFSRMFHRSTGKTFTETIIELRLGHACRLMMKPEVTIAKAGYESGFNNLSIFNRHFKKRYGMTPREWRRAL